MKKTLKLIFFIYANNLVAMDSKEDSKTTSLDYPSLDKRIYDYKKEEDLNFFLARSREYYKNCINVSSVKKKT